MWIVQRYTDRAVKDGRIVPWYWQRCKAFDVLDTAMAHVRHKKQRAMLFSKVTPTFRVYNPTTKDFIMGDIL